MIDIPASVYNKEKYEAIEYIISQQHEAHGIDRQSVGISVTAAFQYLSVALEHKGLDYVIKIISAKEPKDTRNYKTIHSKKKIG